MRQALDRDGFLHRLTVDLVTNRLVDLIVGALGQRDQIYDHLLACLVDPLGVVEVARKGQKTPQLTVQTPQIPVIGIGPLQVRVHDRLNFIPDHA